MKRFLVPLDPLLRRPRGGADPDGVRARRPGERQLRLRPGRRAGAADRRGRDDGRRDGRGRRGRPRRRPHGVVQLDRAGTVPVRVDVCDYEVVSGPGNSGSGSTPAHDPDPGRSREQPERLQGQLPGGQRNHLPDQIRQLLRRRRELHPEDVRGDAPGQRRLRHRAGRRARPAGLDRRLECLLDRRDRRARTTAATTKPTSRPTTGSGTRGPPATTDARVRACDGTSAPARRLHRRRLGALTRVTPTVPIDSFPFCSLRFEAQRGHVPDRGRRLRRRGRGPVPPSTSTASRRPRTTTSPRPSRSAPISDLDRGKQHRRQRRGEGARPLAVRRRRRLRVGLVLVDLDHGPGGPHQHLRRGFSSLSRGLHRARPGREPDQGRRRQRRVRAAGGHLIEFSAVPGSAT